MLGDQLVMKTVVDNGWIHGEREREIGREREREASGPHHPRVLYPARPRWLREPRKRSSIRQSLSGTAHSSALTIPRKKNRGGGWSFYGYLTDWRAVFFFVFFLSLLLPRRSSECPASLKLDPAIFPLGLLNLAPNVREFLFACLLPSPELVPSS